MIRILFISVLLIISQALSAQTKVVTGEFTAFNRYPVKNLKVISKKAKASALTDSLGQYQILCRTKDVVAIESEVFSPLTIRVGKADLDLGRRNLIFINNPQNRELATGYNYIHEDDLTFAMSHLEQENNDFCNYSDIFDLFTGRFAGITVEYVGGKKGIYIRGVNSINLSSEALYVVDNVILDDISHLMPCEVSTIDVMKDGGAALYGARGANGVVIIQTKHFNSLR
ncbi:MAG: TonB-dependent receptor plug domain-containing protein [Bacteroidales bacterium]|nr:TonB-dependent receptor plug domain-containing protein [Bacteroidales bacterium]